MSARTAPVASGINPVTLALVIAGGAVGATARAALTPLGSPEQIWTVNIVGSLLLGILVGFLADRHPRMRAFLGTGVLGAFTTYSAFAALIAQLLVTEPVAAAALVAATLVIGTAVAASGLRIGHHAGRLWHRSSRDGGR